MDWNKFEQALRKEIVRLHGELPRIPRSEVASNAAIGASVMVLNGIADAIVAARPEADT